MKKSLLTMAAVASLMMLGSCSSEEPGVEPAGKTGTVSVELQLPNEMQSRYGEGTTATNLTYAVYEHGSTEALAVCTGGADATVGKATMVNLKTTITLQLTTGKEYDFVFFADAPNSIYTFDKATQSITADYTKLKANAEGVDAFFNTVTYKVTGDASISAELYRPFAQLNILTDDIEASTNAGFAPKESQVVVKQVANTLNLVTGAVSGEADVTYPYDAIATGTMVIRDKEYDYLAMNYLLVNEKKTVDVDFSVKSAKSEERAVTFGNVPVQRNYRTNIYGSLLTNALNVNVEIIPDFNEPDYEYIVVNSAADMLDQLSRGNSVSLGGDITLNDVLVLNNADADVAIDLNGHNIIGSKKLWNDATGNWSVISVRNGAKLTINGNGDIKAATGTLTTAPGYIEDYAIDVQGGAQVIINGGNFKGNDTAVYVYEGSAEINGGTFEVYDNGTSYGSKYNINAFDSNYASGKATIVVKGGTFFGFNPAQSAEKGASLLADGYKAEQKTVDGKTAWVVSAE